MKEETQGPDGEKGEIVFIRGLELTGSVSGYMWHISIKISVLFNQRRRLTKTKALGAMKENCSGGQPIST